MKRLFVALSLCAAGALTASAARAVDVCTYTVTATLGIGCPVRMGETVCLSVSTAIGPCNAALQCYGGVNFFCTAKLTPKSGPQAQCPATSKRPTGFKCFAPVQLVPISTPTSAPADTATFTPTDTPLPETPTETPESEATETETPEATVTETPTGVPTGSATATTTPTEESETATPTQTETAVPATATATATESPTGTPTGTAAALVRLRFR